MRNSRFAAELLSAIVLLSALGLACVSCEARTPPRNLLLITVDTLRADHLGAYGCTRGLTPHNDALAERSEVFTRAYATAPHTLPSIASLMTSRYPKEVGVTANRSTLDADAFTLAHFLSGHGFRTGAVVSNPMLKRRSGMHAGFDHYDVRLPTPEGQRALFERRAEDTTADALKMLDRLGAQDDARLFLWVHYQDPHGPYVPGDALREVHLPRELAEPDGKRMLPVSEDRHGTGAIPKYQYVAPHRQVAFYRAGYAGEVALTDREVGRLLGALEERGLTESTAILFAADHGEGLGEDDYWFAHGEYLSEPMIQVPLLLSVPGGSAGARQQVVSLIDVLPTVAGIFGLPLEQPHRGVDLADRRRASRDRSVFFETHRPATLVPRMGVAWKGYRLVRTLGPEGPTDELTPLPDARGGAAVGEAVAARLSEELERLAAEAAGTSLPDQRTLSDEERDALRALGYLDDEEG